MYAPQKTIKEEVKLIKKVFFVLSSLTSGGSERVFWNLAQGFNKDKFDVTVVILDSTVNCFSMDLEGVRFIDLKTKKASKSFFALYNLLKKEEPYAVFSTTDHINILVSLVGRFLKIPMLIARASNIPHEFRTNKDCLKDLSRGFTSFLPAQVIGVTNRSFANQKK
jgi:hypothetical protein